METSKHTNDVLCCCCTRENIQYYKNNNNLPMFSTDQCSCGYLFNVKDGHFGTCCNIPIYLEKSQSYRCITPCCCFYKDNNKKRTYSCFYCNNGNVQYYPCFCLYKNTEENKTISPFMCSKENESCFPWCCCYCGEKNTFTPLGCCTENISCCPPLLLCRCQKLSCFGKINDICCCFPFMCICNFNKKIFNKTYRGIFRLMMCCFPSWDCHHIQSENEPSSPHSPRFLM